MGSHPKKAAGVITNKERRTSYASIVAHELGTTAIMGSGNATQVIKDGEIIIIICVEEKIRHITKDKLKYLKATIALDQLQLPWQPKMKLIVSQPEKAFELSLYPNDGIGLLRLEFIITRNVKIHPVALIPPKKIDSP